jgi:hypothetical protein
MFSLLFDSSVGTERHFCSILCCLTSISLLTITAIAMWLVLLIIKIQIFTFFFVDIPSNLLHSNLLKQMLLLVFKSCDMKDILMYFAMMFCLVSCPNYHLSILQSVWMEHCLDTIGIVGMVLGQIVGLFSWRFVTINVRNCMLTCSLLLLHNFSYIILKS